jgi:antitoxin (DNA-binding transcriptional repressor) of toxin-antitoxin stability system
MNESVLLVLRFAMEIGKLTEQLVGLIKRVRAGEEITQTDIDIAKTEAATATANWDAAANKQN